MTKIVNYSPKYYLQIKALLQNNQMFDDYFDSQDNILGLTKNYPEGVLIAIDNKKVVGTLFVTLYGTRVAWLFRLVVEESHRNQGLATKLIDRATKNLKKLGVLEIGLFANAENADLYKFYQKRGYTSSNKSWIYMYKNHLDS